MNTIKPATPLPWKVVYTAPSEQVTVMQGNFCIADCGKGDGAIEHAQEIVTARNAFPRLTVERAELESLLAKLTSEILDDINECNGRGVDGYVSIYARVQDARKLAKLGAE